MIFKTFSDAEIHEARACHEQDGGCLVTRNITNGHGHIVTVLVVGEFADLVDAGWDEDYLLGLAPHYDATR